MELLTQQQREQMLANGRANARPRSRRKILRPVVRFLCPWSEAVWLSDRTRSRRPRHRLRPLRPWHKAFPNSAPCASPKWRASRDRSAYASSATTVSRRGASFPPTPHCARRQPRIKARVRAPCAGTSIKRSPIKSSPNWRRACARGSGHGTRATWKAASRSRCGITASPIAASTFSASGWPRMAKGYRAPIWMTFKQAIDLGGGVRKGEKGSLTVYADNITRKETDAATRRGIRNRHSLHEGLHGFQRRADRRPARALLPRARAQPARDPLPRIARADAFFAATGAAIRHGGDSAPTTPSAAITFRCRRFEAFRDPESYYATLAHEMHALDAACLAPRPQLRAQALRR